MAISAQERNLPVQHFGTSNLDTTLNCIRTVYGKPAIWDDIDTNLLIQPCPSSRKLLQDSLATYGIRVFDAADFVFIIPSNLFQAPAGGTEPPHVFLKWSTITIHLNLQSLRESDEMPEYASEIAKEILKRARMVPFALGMSNHEGFPVTGAVETHLNIALWVGQLGPDKGQSVVALINARPDYFTARIVYGEWRNGEYVMRWDSPLFNVLHGDAYFQDVNGDGSKEIVIESTSYGNQEYPLLVVFDKNGRELTRQSKCETRFLYGRNFDERDGTCAIYGAAISFSENQAGPKDIYVNGWYGDRENHVFKLSNGVYIPGPPVKGSFPPMTEEASQISDPAVFNRQGLEFMKRKDYASAVTKFMGASLLAGDKNSEYTNNVGYALYMEEKYDLAVSWLKKAVAVDANRAVAYMNLGDAYAKLNRNSDARQAYAKYLELAPNSKSAPDIKKKLDTLPPAP
jgi:hypothetical protein